MVFRLQVAESQDSLFLTAAKSAVNIWKKETLGPGWLVAQQTYTAQFLYCFHYVSANSGKADRKEPAIKAFTVASKYGSGFA